MELWIGNDLNLLKFGGMRKNFLGCSRNALSSTTLVAILLCRSLNWKFCSFVSRVHRKAKLYDLHQSILSKSYFLKSKSHLF